MPTPGKQRAPEAKALFLATFLLLAGVAVYALDRGGAAHFLSGWSPGPAAPAIFGPLGDHLPTFLHPLVFILITAAVLRPWPRWLPTICAAWFAVECLFELGQMAPLNVRIAAAMPLWFDGVPVLRNTADYFTHGTFDPLDILSIGIGTVIAYPIARSILKGERR